MSKLYPVQEIGSLAKPRWRTKGLTQPLSSKDLVEAEEWAQRLCIPDFQDRAKQLLAAQEQNDRVRELLELSTIYGLRLFEQTGLDNVGVGGEQQRVEMYEHVIRGVEGMRVLGHVQSFDYKYFNKAVAESKIHRKHPIYLQEFLDVKKKAKREFLLDFVEQVIRPEIRDLVDAGAEWIQIDEPAITTHPEPADMNLFVE